MALTAEEKERIMAERGESGREATGKMRRFSIKFKDGRSTTMLDPKGSNIGDAWAGAIDRFGPHRIRDIIVQGESGDE